MLKNQSELLKVEMSKLQARLNSSKSEGSTVSAKEDLDVRRKRKFDQRADEAKDTNKASPTTPPRAMVNGFEILSTSAVLSKSESEADDEEMGESQGKVRTNSA